MPWSNDVRKQNRQKMADAKGAARCMQKERKRDRQTKRPGDKKQKTEGAEWEKKKSEYGSVMALLVSVNYPTERGHLMRLPTGINLMGRTISEENRFSKEEKPHGERRRIARGTLLS